MPADPDAGIQATEELGSLVKTSMGETVGPKQCVLRLCLV
jgi:hypothetical protein